jgi:hypothetical protein
MGVGLAHELKGAALLTISHGRLYIPQRGFIALKNVFATVPACTWS